MRLLHTIYSLGVKTGDAQNGKSSTFFVLGVTFLLRALLLSSKRNPRKQRKQRERKKRQQEYRHVCVYEQALAGRGCWGVEPSLPPAGGGEQEEEGERDRPL